MPTRTPQRRHFPTKQNKTNQNKTKQNSIYIYILITVSTFTKYVCRYMYIDIYICLGVGLLSYTCIRVCVGVYIYLHTYLVNVETVIRMYMYIDIYICRIECVLERTKKNQRPKESLSLPSLSYSYYVCHTHICHIYVCHTHICHIYVCHTHICHIYVCHTHIRHIYVCHIYVCHTHIYVCHTHICHICVYTYAVYLTLLLSVN